MQTCHLWAGWWRPSGCVVCIDSRCPVYRGSRIAQVARLRQDDDRLVVGVSGVPEEEPGPLAGMAAGGGDGWGVADGGAMRLALAQLMYFIFLDAPEPR